MPIEKSAGAVVFYKSSDKIEYLLLHYDVGHWDFPKGWIERREESKEAAEREIGEETGIKSIEFIPGFEEHIEYFFKWEDKNIFKTVTFFLARTNQKEVKLSDEHTGFRWLAYKEAIEQLTFKNAKNVLKKADDFISKKGL